MHKAIRVFLSSTFLDMQQERDYLNRIVFPRFQRECRKRGVSFYCVDLRWGITEEESRNHQTINLCLAQVEKCQPYFISLLGNRYGWIPDNSELLEQSYPWMRAYPGRSATELEIIYYLLHSPNKADAFFACKASSLEESRFDDGQQAQILALKNHITAETGHAPVEYASVEALAEQVYAAMMVWLDEKHPSVARADQLENDIAYYRNLMRSASPFSILATLERQDPEVLSHPLKYAGESVAGFDTFERVVHSCGYAFLVEPAYCEFTCNRYFDYVAQYNSCICIHLDASQRLRSGYEICRRLLQELIKKYPAFAGSAAPLREKESAQTYRKLCSAINHILKTLNDPQPLYIFITNLHLLSRDHPDYWLNFLPACRGENVHIVVSSADRDQSLPMEACGVCTVHPFPIKIGNDGFYDSAYLANFLSGIYNRGKKLTVNHIDTLFKNGVFRNQQETDLAVHYLINYVTFDHLDASIALIAGCTAAGKSVFRAILDRRMEDLDATSRNAAGLLLQLICTAALEESELCDILHQCGVSNYTFTRAMEAIRPLLGIQDGGYCLFAPCFASELPEPALPDAAANSLYRSYVQRISDQPTQDSLKTAYRLMGLLIRWKHFDLLKQFVSLERILELSRTMDYHLLRMGWKTLHEAQMLNMEELYPVYIGKNATASYRNPIYDFFIKLETSVREKSEFDDYLDIPSYHSTDLERWFLDDLSTGEYQYFRSLQGLAGYKLPDSGLSLMRNSLDLTADFCPMFRAYLHDVVCKYLHRLNAFCSKYAMRDYLLLARQSGNMRMFADAWRLLEKTDKNTHIPDHLNQKLEPYL